MSDNPFAQGDYQHSVSVQGTEADNGWVLTKAQWDQVMAALHQHGIMDANSTIDAPHPNVSMASAAIGQGLLSVNEDYILIAGESAQGLVHFVETKLSGGLPRGYLPRAYIAPVFGPLATDDVSLSIVAEDSTNKTELFVGSGTSGGNQAAAALREYDTNNLLAEITVQSNIAYLRTYSGGSLDGQVTLSGTLFSAPRLGFGFAGALTIATGAVTATQSYHTIETQGGAASDDLDTISGGSTGQMLVIRAVNSAHTVVAKDGTGNLKLAGDCTLDNAEDTLTLIYDGANWLEISRSDNGA